MKESLKWQLLLIFLLTAFAGYLAYPAADKPFFADAKINPGLDLQGGSELILGFKGDIPPAAAKAGIESAQNIIERRINALGLKEPRIQRYGSDQLQIQLPGVAVGEIRRIKEILTTSGNLELKLQAEKSIRDVYTKPPDAPPGYSWPPLKPVKEGERAPESVLVNDTPVLTGTHIVKANWSYSQHLGNIVEIKLNREGTAILADTSEKYSEEGGDARQLAIILDGKLYSAPVIHSKITDGKPIISNEHVPGGLPTDEAQDLAMILSCGNLPAPLTIRSENSVGASLGADTIRRGFFSFALSIIIVALFMMAYYHGAGIIAVISLLMNAILLVGILAIFNATLTLPGIAGIVLTMGMAVDSNIIFYERIREEKEKGRPINLAFEGGFARAFITVFDANITTLLAGMILWFFGTGAVRGFAVTLSVGILTTLFTGYFATKVMIQFCVETGLIKKFSMFKLLSKPNVNFTGYARPLIIGSFILMMAGLFLFLGTTNKTFGVDFTGGTVLNMQFRQEQDISKVRGEIKSISGTDKAKPKYADAEIQSVIPPVTQTGIGGLGDLLSGATSHSRIFQIRSPDVRTEEGLKELKDDLVKLFGERLMPEPKIEIKKGEREPWAEEYKLKVTLETTKPYETSFLQDKLRLIALDKGKSEPRVLADTAPGITPTPTTRFFIFTHEDDPEGWEIIIRQQLLQEAMQEGPFPLANTIGAMVSHDLQRNAVISILLSWLVMIIYIALRFEMSYGIGAVVALIHDVLIAMGVTVLFKLLAPESWGINVEINFASVAAFMTIIGYSVNDTIVVFDRIRENLREMKGADFNTIINRSVNQTLSRTILTALTVFFTVIILFGLTARSGSGIASFAFPMIVGTIAGSYSTIFIASPVAKFFRGEKPRG